MKKETSYIATLSAATISLHAFIDKLMGAEAEYFNLWFMLRNIFSPQQINYSVFQSSLGSFALPVAIIVLLAVHISIATLITKSIKNIIRK